MPDIIIILAVLGGLFGLMLVGLLVNLIYNKVTEDQFRQERIRRLSATKHEIKPFSELSEEE